MKLLLDRGADPMQKDNAGMTALKLAGMHPKILALIHKQQVSIADISFHLHDPPCAA